MGTVKDGVVKRGNTWSFVIRVTNQATGASRPRWVGGFRSEGEAKAARDRARVAARRGEYVDQSRIAVKTYLEEWLAGHAATVKPKTWIGYRNDLRTYVIPRIGSMRLQALRPATISKLYAELAKSGGKGGPAACGADGSACASVLAQGAQRCGDDRCSHVVQSDSEGQVAA